MTIQAQLPGGLTLEFPDGTPDAIVQGAVKQQLSQQPDSASQTPESKLGLTPAPPEEKPPAEGDLGTFSPEGVYVPAGTVPAQGSPQSKAAARSVLGLPDTITQDQRNQIDAPSPAERVWQSVKEGWQNAPTLLPPESGQQVTPGSGLGVNQPLVTIGNTILGAGNALLSGAQRFAYESIAPYSKTLARDVAAAPEAFPTGDYGQVAGPRTVLQARNAVERATPQVPLVPQAVTDAVTSPFSATRPISVQEVMDAIKRSDIQPQVQQNGMMPGETPPPSGPAPSVQAGAQPPPNMPPVSPGSVRVYHGGSDPTSGGPRWVTPNYQYARDYREGQPVSYVDVPMDHPVVQAATNTVDDQGPGMVAPQPVRSFEAPEEIAKQLKPVPEPQPAAPPQPTHIYQGPEYDQPVTPTGNEQTHTDGRVYAEVQPPDGPVTWVPKEHLAEAPQPTPAAAQITPPGQATLTPEQAAAAGAQTTPAAELGVTPAEEAAYRSTAEGNKLLEPQEPGVRDTTQYLPGEKINEAEASQDVQTARNLKSLRQQTPQLDADMTADENFNNNLRSNAINKALPGRVQIQQATAARQQAMEANEPKVFGGPNVTDADTQPIVQTIQNILNEPKNLENSQLKQYVKPLLDRLQNADGTPRITDPLQLWGWRQDVQHLTSKAAQLGDPNLSRVSGLLGKVLDSTDNQLEAAAPGYKANLRDEYRTRSQQIDAMTALNDERFKLFDSQNKPNYNAVQGLMRRIVDARQEADPYEPFTHVTQETLDSLWNIRDSMRRTQAADRLASTRGSPTSQNIGDALRKAGKMAMQGAAPAIGATIGSAVIPIPGVGPAVGLTAGAIFNHWLTERAMSQRLAEGRSLLSPNGLAPGAPP